MQVLMPYLGVSVALNYRPVNLTHIQRQQIRLGTTKGKDEKTCSPVTSFWVEKASSKNL